MPNDEPRVVFMRTGCFLSMGCERLSRDAQFSGQDQHTTYGITPSIDLFVNIRNLLDETYIVSDRPYGVRPGLPRTVMGGLRFSL
jgi:outer membrane receptor for ferric coprogen and ferric-rhodotorulic acid